MTFTLVELTLDLLYLVQKHTGLDLEASYIFLVVSNASMRPVVLDPGVPERVRLQPSAPEEYRGSISRRAIADKTGIARETVRRRTKELAEKGLVLIGKDDRIRSAGPLDDPAIYAIVEAGHAAVRRYIAHLATLGFNARDALF